MDTVIDRRALDQRIAFHRGRGIVTGMLEYACPEDLPPFHQLFGSGLAFRPAYETYFHWYNLIHELGHIARSEFHLSCVGTSAIAEEKHANDFAVAYWTQYGELSRRRQLVHIVSSGLRRSTATCQPAELLDYYGHEPNFQRACRSPLKYGFIQFCLVRLALDHIHHDFAAELERQGFSPNHSTTKAPAPRVHRRASLQAIVDEAVGVLRSLGIQTPDVQVFPHYNPMEHRAI